MSEHSTTTTATTTATTTTTTTTAAAAAAGTPFQHIHHHPSALRNRLVIKDLMKEILAEDSVGLGLAISEGTGAHVEVLSPMFLNVTFIPTEYIPPPDALATKEELGKISGIGSVESPTNDLDIINIYGTKLNKNVLPALGLNLNEPVQEWNKKITQDLYLFIYAFNVVHITNWGCTVNLFSAAGKLLRPDGMLLFYGPYKRDGKCTTESNEQFDSSLKKRNAAWGLRDLEKMEEEAKLNHLFLEQIRDCPSNNFFLVFKRLDTENDKKRLKL